MQGLAIWLFTQIVHMRQYFGSPDEKMNHEPLFNKSQCPGKNSVDFRLRSRLPISKSHRPAAQENIGSERIKEML